jgi:RNA polymerase sigma-70 factor, ECF subfamily
MPDSILPVPGYLLKNSTTFNRLGADAEDDAALVAMAKQDSEAFGLLYQRYVERMYRYLFSHVGEPSAAEDLTAQVFVAAWEGLGRYQERGEFAAWLFRIARNKANDYYRRRRVHLSYENSKEGSGMLQQDSRITLTELEHNEDLERLASLIKCLKPHQVELLRLRFAANLSYAEMANILGRSTASIKMAMSRLLRQLKAKWETSNGY